MKNITNEQIITILELANNPLIDYTDISHHRKSGNVNITISSKLDACLTDVLTELHQPFSKITASEPFHIDRDDGTCSDIYNVTIDGIRASLHIISTQKEKAPALTEAPIETTHLDYTSQEVAAQ